MLINNQFNQIIINNIMIIIENHIKKDLINII